MLKRNMDIRKAKGDIPAWIIAEKLGIHEKTFFSWLRTEMSAERKTAVYKAINDAKKEFLLEGK